MEEAVAILVAVEEHVKEHAPPPLPPRTIIVHQLPSTTTAMATTT
jgi:hypothetical protein